MFSPVQPAETGVASYTARLVAELAQVVSVDLFAAQASPGQGPVPVYAAQRFPDMAGQYGTIIYHVGNSPLHAYLYPYLLRYPGVIVAHDWSCHGMVHAALGPDAYRQVMAREHGASGLSRAEEVLRDGLDGDISWQYPLNHGVLESGQMVLVHSRWMRDRVSALLPGKPVHMVRMGTALQPPDHAGRAALRTSLGIGEHAPVLGSFGYLTPHKRLDVALRVFARLRETVPALHFLIAGDGSARPGLERFVQSHGLSQQVHFLGGVSEERFNQALAATDIAMNLRYPSYGETSASLYRILGAGLPAIATATGSFVEVPDSVCWKVEPDVWEEPLLFAYLRELAANEALRTAMAGNALAYAADHTWERVAADYLAVMGEGKGGAADTHRH